jgi:hypothetical protein
VQNPRFHETLLQDLNSIFTTLQISGLQISIPQLQAATCTWRIGITATTFKKKSFLYKREHIIAPTILVDTSHALSSSLRISTLSNKMDVGI